MFKRKLVEFRCRADMIDALPHPLPAAKAMPNWFAKLSRNIKSSDLSDGGTIKRCIPVLDAVSLGYIIPLWGDLHVKVTNNFKAFDADDNAIADLQSNDEPNLDGLEVNGVKIHRLEKSGLHIWCKFPDGFDAGSGQDISGHHWSQVGDACPLNKFELGKVLLKFANPWTIETPKGFSVYFKNPANSWETNIEVLEGVVDTDRYSLQVNFPYVWTGTEVGEWIIPKGTPLVQVIPFRRERTKFSVKTYNLSKIAKLNALLFSKYSDRYRSLFWHKAHNKN